MYVKLAKEHRKITAELRAMGEGMRDYRDLPVGRHDRNAIASPKVLEAFAKFVKLEQEQS